MIVPANKSDSSSQGSQSKRKGVQSADNSNAINTAIDLDSTGFPNEPPPEYSSANSPTTNPETQEAQPYALEAIVPPVPTTVTSSKAVNYISLNQPLSSINCTYVIDPLIQIPQSFLPALAPGQSEADRKNLSIRTKMGSITADVTLWHDDSAERNPRDGNRPRVNLEMKTMVGAMDVKVRDPPPSPSSKRPSFRLRCFTRTGALVLQIPRSFHGFISVATTVGRTVLSEDLEAAAYWLDSDIRTRRCFVGDMSGLSKSEGEDAWVGDEVKLETMFGVARIRYVGEKYREL